MAAGVEKKVEEIFLKLAEDTDFELVDVEYVKERDWYLRIFVDKPGGVDLDDCQILSEKIGEILDKESFINGSYILEVSSPGIDRVLKKDKDFIREKGKKVDVSLYAPIDGQKNLTGTLVERDEKFLKLEEFEPLPREKVAQVRLHIDF